MLVKIPQTLWFETILIYCNITIILLKNESPTIFNVNTLDILDNILVFK
jgi:hypothetical protein